LAISPIQIIISDVISSCPRVFLVVIYLWGTSFLPLLLSPGRFDIHSLLRIVTLPVLRLPLLIVRNTISICLIFLFLWLEFF
jgi:hypothetical protein